jgi:hypothetical protein
MVLSINLVAQISNLLYRGIVFCKAHEISDRMKFVALADWKSAIQQIGNLRYKLSAISRD